MNFTRLILAITLSYLLLMTFTSNVNARERLEDVTIQIMDINDDIDDFINRIELPAPAREKIVPDGGETTRHVRPHVHENPADDLREHDHPRENVLAGEHGREEAPAHELTHEVTAMDIGASPAEDMDKAGSAPPEVEREALSEKHEESREKMKESLEHAENPREDIAGKAREAREKVREHAETRGDD